MTVYHLVKAPDITEEALLAAFADKTERVEFVEICEELQCHGADPAHGTLMSIPFRSANGFQRKHYRFRDNIGVLFDVTGIDQDHRTVAIWDVCRHSLDRYRLADISTLSPILRDDTPASSR
ncbi:MAG: hypothetical protein RLY86_99 [Pseudomonadota bacterium]|jgi:hypothetical protein